MTFTNKKREKERIEKIFQLLKLMYPNAKCELNYANNFQLLLAVMLSAQTTDKAVNKALLPLFENNSAFSASDLIELGEKTFFTCIKGIGLATTKSKNALAMASLIIDKFNGNVPTSKEDLLLIPGVGPKTANVVLNVLFKQPTMPVDTHVARVASRLGFVPKTSNVTKTEELLLQIIPNSYALQAHHLLIFLGRYQCKARNPLCESCKLVDICPQIL